MAFCLVKNPRDGSLTPCFIEQGSVVDAGNLTDHIVDAEALIARLCRLRKSDVLSCAQNLGLNVNGRMTIEQLSNIIGQNFDAIIANATVINVLTQPAPSAPASSADGGYDNVVPFAGRSQKLDGSIRLHILFTDLRTPDGTTYGGFKVQIEPTLSPSSLGVKIIEEFEGSELFKSLTLVAPYFRQALFYKDMALVRELSMASLESLGIKNGDAIEMKIWKEDDPEFAKLWEDKPEEEETKEEETDDEMPVDFSLVVKSPDLRHHILLKIKRSDTVLYVKQLMMFEKIKGKAGEKPDEQFVLASTAPLAMRTKDGKLMEDFSTIGSYFETRAYGGEVNVKFSRDTEQMSEYGLFFLRCAMFNEAVKDGSLYDGKVINAYKVKKSKLKGTAIIKVNEMQFHFPYGVDECVKHIHEAFEHCGIYCGDETGELNPFRLKYTSSCSLLEGWQKIYAEFGNSATFELVATLRGGGKQGVMRAIAKGKNNKKEFYKKIECDVCANIPSLNNSCQLTETIGNILTYLRTYTGSKEVLFKQAMSCLSKEELVSSKAIMETFGRFGSTEDKVERISRKFMGKHIQNLDQHIEQLEGLKTALIATINRHYAEWCMKDTGKYDNQPFIKMIDDLLAGLDGESLATEDQLASVLSGMHLTQ
eukprot:Skav201274  [mRNA]  locus=scaffold2058:114237:116183:- [translate_table: standard]